MEIYSFTKDTGKVMNKFNSNFIMSRIINTLGSAHVGCMYLEKDGIIGFHQAVVPQLLIIVNGNGLVRGENDVYSEVQAGDAIFWRKGEWHETKSDKGLTAIVIEGEDIDPASSMPIKK